MRLIFTMLVVLMMSNAASAQGFACAEDFHVIFQSETPNASGLSDEVDDGRVDEIVVHVQPGQKGVVTFYAAIVSNTKGPGILGWQLGFDSDDLNALRPSVEGTVTGDVRINPASLVESGFSITTLGYNHAGLDVESVFSVTILSFDQDGMGTRLPQVGTATICALTYETHEALEAGQEMTGHVELEVVDLYGAATENAFLIAHLPDADGYFEACNPASVQIRFTTSGPPIRRGDTNADNRVDVSDAIFVFSWLFLGGPAPECQDTADTNDSGSIDLTDGLLVLLDIFSPGRSIVPPGPFDCGTDLTEDELPCATFGPCS